MIYGSSCLSVVVTFQPLSSNVLILFTLLSPFQTNLSWWGQGNIVKDFLWLLMISCVFIRATMLSNSVTYLAHSKGITFQSIARTSLAHDWLLWDCNRSAPADCVSLWECMGFMSKGASVVCLYVELGCMWMNVKSNNMVYMIRTKKEWKKWRQQKYTFFYNHVVYI